MLRELFKKMILELLSFLLIISISNLWAEELTVMTENWPPYNYLEKGTVTGFSTDIVKEIMKELNISSEIIVLPGARGESYARTKKNHVLFSLFRTKAREAIYKWVGPLATEEVYFFKKKGNPIVIKNIDDVKKQGLRIASMHEGMIYNHLQSLGFKRFIRSYVVKESVKQLHKNQADLIALTPLGISYLLNELNLPLDSIVQTSIKLFQNDLYIVISKKTDNKIVQKWQNALDKIKSSDRYKQIYMNYLK